MDDGKCHICRQWPIGQNPMYRLTTCASCEETARARSAERWRFGDWVYRHPIQAVLLFTPVTYTVFRLLGFGG